MHKNAPFCTDACNTPVYYTPLACTQVIRGLLPRGPERLSGLGGGSSGASERCVRFQRSGEKKVGHSEAPKRPRFSGCPLRRFQPSGSNPQATDKNGGRLDPSLPLIHGYAPFSGPSLRQEKGTQTQTLVRICLGGVGVFHMKGCGPKSSLCSSKTQGNQTIWRDIPGFLPGFAGISEKFEKKFVFDLWPLLSTPVSTTPRVFNITSGNKSNFLGLRITQQTRVYPTPWARGLRDQIQKWSLQTQKTLYF